MHTATGAFLISVSLVSILRYRCQRKLYSTSLGVSGLHPTDACFEIFYVWLCMGGLVFMFRGVYVWASRHADPWLGPCIIVSGLVVELPLLFVILFGREVITDTVVRRFDLDRNRAERDGAFVAELLESAGNSHELFDIWWIHRDAEDTRFPKFDHLRNWRQAVVVEVHENVYMGVGVARYAAQYGAYRR